MMSLNPGRLPRAEEKLQSLVPESEDRHPVSVTCTFTGDNVLADKIWQRGFVEKERPVLRSSEELRQLAIEYRERIAELIEALIARAIAR